MSDDLSSKHAFRWELRQRLVERLRIPWDGMGDMANQQRAEAAIAISTMMDEIEAWRRSSQQAERDIVALIRERDAARREILESMHPDVRTAHANAREWDFFDVTNHRLPDGKDNTSTQGTP